MAEYGYSGYSQGSSSQNTVKRLDEEKKKYVIRKQFKRRASERLNKGKSSEGTIQKSV